MRITANLEVREATRQDFIQDGHPYYGRIYFICEPGDDLLRGPYVLNKAFAKDPEFKQALQAGCLQVLEDYAEQPWMKSLKESWKNPDT